MGDRRGIQPGHEVGGVVETVSDGVTLPTGTPVAIEPAHGCGTCHHCQGGFANRCQSLTLFGVTANGGMADLLVVPEHCVYPLAETVSTTMGAMCDEGFSAADDSNAGRLMHYLFWRPPWPPDPPDPLMLLPPLLPLLLKMLLKMLLPPLLPAMPACDAYLRCLLAMLRDLAPQRGC